MKSNNKQNKSTTLIPIAMMFLAVGVSITTISIWLKYSFMIISIILSAIALFLSLKNSNNKDK